MKKLLFVLGIIGVISLAQATEVKLADVIDANLTTNLVNKGVDIQQTYSITNLPYISYFQLLKYCKENNCVNEMDDLLAAKLLWMRPEEVELLPKTWVNMINAKYANAPELRDWMLENKKAYNYAPLNIVLKYVTNDNVDWNTIKTLISREGTKIIKRGLRAQGKSFVTRTLDDGTEFNPMAEPTAELSAILNSARFAGLNEWFAKYNSNIRLTDTGFLADADLNQLKEDILFGEKELNPNIKILVKNMSVDDYNAFIKEYNEGSAQ